MQGARSSHQIVRRLGFCGCQEGGGTEGRRKKDHNSHRLRYNVRNFWGSNDGCTTGSSAKKYFFSTSCIHPRHFIDYPPVSVDRDGIILEKPEDAQHAYAMLSSLSGRTHLVHSGVAIYSSKGPKSGDGIPLPVVSFCETSRVDFAPLSDEEIWNYIRCVTNPRLLGWNL